MGSFDFTAVFQSGPVWGGCGPKSITCYGSARHVAIFEETGTGVQPQRRIFSADDGVTWTESAPYYSTNSLWFGPSTSPASNVVLVGNIGPNVPSGDAGEDAGVARSSDGAATWMSGLTASLAPATDTWDCDLLLVSGPYNGATRLLAGGWFNIGPDYFNLLLSDDGGQTWPTRLGMTAGEFDPAHLSCGCACGNGVILLGSEGMVYDAVDWIAGHPLWRSIDNGATWTRIQLTSALGEDESNRLGLKGIAHLGGSYVAACAEGYDGSNNSLPLLWLSADLGATWTELSANLLPVWGDPAAVHWLTLLAGYGDGQYLVACVSRQDPSVPAALFSEDRGATWQVATVPDVPLGQTEVELTWAFQTKADTGPVLATLGRLTSEVGADVYPDATILLGATSGQAVTLQATAAVWPDPYTALLQHIKFTAGGEVIIVGWLSATQVWVNFVTSPASVGPYATGEWYIHPASRQYWEIWRGVGSWPMGAGPCAVAAPVRRVTRATVPARSPLPGCPPLCQIG